jgi:UDP-N-acetylglucosamine transferase subunit ALG13
LIFLTVGSQEPFDRLVRAIDEWAALHPSHKVRAQIGASALQPLHMSAHKVLSPSEFRDHVANADLVIAHAGMGSVLTAGELCKPLVVMPRRSEFGETRNDHQLSTARWLVDRSRIEVAWQADDLPAALERALRLATPTTSPSASQKIPSLVPFLVRYLRQVAAEKRA